ncbi:MAG: ComEC/Rec2 family competence protein [Paracoccaceae bacterium]
MSFTATTVLVAGFGMLRDSGVMGRVPGWSKPVLALVLSSALAGFATAPIAAAHFNRIAEYGLLANLLSVPVMGLVVMPMAVIAALLAPVGLAWLPLVLMGWGCAGSSGWPISWPGLTGRSRRFRRRPDGSCRRSASGCSG